VNSLAAATVTTIPAFTGGGTTTICPTAATCTTVPSQIIGGSSGLASSGLGVSSTSATLSSIAGVAVEVLAVASMAALVGIIVIAVVANRADPDPTGRRPQSVYYFVVSFVTVTTGILGSALVVASILWLTARHSSATDHPIARLLLVSVLVFVVSVGLFVTHLRRGLVLARTGPAASNPSQRVGQSYVSVVAFVSVVVLLLTAVLAVYLVFAVASPATFGSFGGRGVTVRVLIEVLYLTVVAVLVHWAHSSLLTPRLGLFGRASRLSESDTPIP
jgi:hypothetical protein